MSIKIDIWFQQKLVQFSDSASQLGARSARQTQHSVSHAFQGVQVFGF